MNFKKNEEKELVDLSRFDLFNGVSETTLDAFYEKLEIRKIKKGALIVSENKKAEYVYIILDGLAKLYKNIDDRNEVIIHIKGKDDIIANTAVSGVYGDGNFHLSVKAVTDLKVAMIPSGLVFEMMDKDIALSHNTVKHLCKRIISSEDKIKELSSEDSYSRVAKELLKFEDYYKMKLEDGTVFNVGISRSEFASIVGISREMVSRILSSFAESGIIEVSGKNIKLLDREKLESWEL